MWAAAVLAALWGGAVWAEEDKTPDIEKAFREGVDLFQQGRFGDAQRKFREVMALSPRKELAARLVDECGTKMMAKMMAEPRMGNEPAYIWQYYRDHQIRKLADKERMAKMAQRLVDAATSDPERALLYREFGQIAHYAVPLLAPYLKDATHESHRTFARIAISRMGSRAVLPVIELLSDKDVLMRENAALVLADIQPLDPRAIPALRARLDDASESPSVKNVATVLLKRLTGLDSAALKSTADYCHDAAWRYLLDRPGVAEEAAAVDGMIWHLNAAGELTPVSYPLWAWNEQMAEELALRGLAANADHAGLMALWPCVVAGEYTEVKDLLDLVNEQPPMHSFSVEEKKDVEGWDKKVVDCRRLIAMAGKEHVNAALNKALTEIKRYPAHGQLPRIAAALAKELAALDPRGELLTPPADVTLNALPGKEPVVVQTFVPVTVQAERAGMDVTVKAGSIVVINAPDVAAPGAEKEKKNGKKEKKEKKEEGAKKEEAAPAAATPPAAEVAAVPAAPAVPAPAVSTSGIVNGLDCLDFSVQYACALALAATDRHPVKWIGSDKVAAILGRGVSEDKSAQILLVEENANAANEMRQRLQALGYGVTVAVSGRDAVLQARSHPPKDAAVVSEDLRRDLTTEQTLEELRADVRTRYLAVGILHPQKDRTNIQSRFPQAALVEREMNGAELKTATEAVLAKRAAESLPKRRAHETSVACATALSKIDPRQTYLVLEDAILNASDALVNRKDDVRIPCAVFLGRTEGGSKKTAVAEKLKAVVLDTANAVELRRAALLSLGRVQKDGLEETYAKLQADPDQEIKDLAAEAFGQVSRANKAILELITSQRIDKDKKEK
jgi:CheY-like chemotaxis protein